MQLPMLMPSGGKAATEGDVPKGAAGVVFGTDGDDTFARLLLTGLPLVPEQAVAGIQQTQGPPADTRSGVGRPAIVPVLSLARGTEPTEGVPRDRIEVDVPASPDLRSASIVTVPAVPTTNSPEGSGTAPEVPLPDSGVDLPAAASGPAIAPDRMPSVAMGEGPLVPSRSNTPWPPGTRVETARPGKRVAEGSHEMRPGRAMDTPPTVTGRPMSPDRPAAPESPVASPPHAPPEQARAIGLAEMSGTADPAVPTPARDSERLPVTVPSAASDGSSKNSEAPSGGVPDELPIPDEGGKEHRPERPAPRGQAPMPVTSALPATETQTQPSRIAHRGARKPELSRPVAPDAPSVAANAGPGTEAPTSTKPALPDAAAPRDPIVAVVGTPDARPMAEDDPAQPLSKTATAPEARPVVQQVVHAISRTQRDGVVEVRLHPEELGRVRIAIMPAEAGHTVQVMAERAETLDLIRRHIDLLSGDLRDKGFGALDFSFGQERQGYAPGHASETGARDDDSLEPSRGIGLDARAVLRPSPLLDGHLDMRL